MKMTVENIKITKEELDEICEYISFILRQLHDKYDENLDFGLKKSKKGDFLHRILESESECRLQAKTEPVAREMAMKISLDTAIKQGKFFINNWNMH